MGRLFVQGEYSSVQADILHTALLHCCDIRWQHFPPGLSSVGGAMWLTGGLKTHLSRLLERYTALVQKANSPEVFPTLWS